MNTITVLIADDHPIFRKGLREIITAEPSLKLVAEVEDGARALQAIRSQRPQVAVLDVDMPEPDGISVARTVKEERLPVAVVLLTMHRNERFFNAALDLGVAGYVLKDSPAAQLLGAIREVQRGGSYLSPRMLSQLVDDFRSRVKSTQRTPRFATLTTREKEVLKVLAEGNSVKEIAGGLNLSVKTVEAHKFNLMRKLDIHNKAQLVQYAIQKKIIQIPSQSAPQ